MKIMCKEAECTLQNYNELFGGAYCINCRQWQRMPRAQNREILKCSLDENDLFNANDKWHHISHFPLRQMVQKTDASFSVILANIANDKALHRKLNFFCILNFMACANPSQWREDSKACTLLLLVLLAMVIKGISFLFLIMYFTAFGIGSFFPFE